MGLGMRLAFNLLSLPGPRIFGVGAFVRSMCAEAEHELARRDAHLMVIHHADTDPAIFNLGRSARISHRAVQVRGRFSRVAWEQAVLPHVVRGIHLLYSPNNVNPVWLPRSVRSIITIHDMLPFRRQSRFGGLQKGYLTAATRLSAHRAACVVTVSRSSASAIAETLGMPQERIVVVQNVAEPVPISSNEPFSSAPYFLVLGSVQDDKRIDKVIEAFARFGRSHPNHRLVVMGADHGALSALRTLAARLDLSERIVFTGYVSPETKWRALQGCTAVVMFGREEGFGIPVLEALAAGRPSLIAPEGALREVAGPAGVVVDPQDPEAVAGAMAMLVADPQALRQAVERRRTQFDSGVQRQHFWETLFAHAQ